MFTDYQKLAMESKCEMNISCGCSGIRTCLLCEEKKGLRNSTYESPLITYHICHSCGKVFRSVVAPSSPPLQLCSTYCLTNKPSLQASLCVGEATRIPEFKEVIVVKSFVSEEEERSIVAEIDHSKWAESQSGRRKQDYGPKVNFKRQKVKLGLFNGLPHFSKMLLQRMHSTLPELMNFEPVELCNLEYVPDRGSSIDPHCDDSWIWGERLVTLNLLSHTILTFSIPPHGHTSTTAPPQGPLPSQASPSSPSSHSVEIHVPLPQRSLVIVSGAARHVWHHSVKREHIVSRRVAVTLRELTSEFLPGGRRYEDVGQTLLETASNFDGQPTNFTV